MWIRGRRSARGKGWRGPARPSALLAALGHNDGARGGPGGGSRWEPRSWGGQCFEKSSNSSFVAPTRFQGNTALKEIHLICLARTEVEIPRWGGVARPTIGHGIKEDACSRVSTGGSDCCGAVGPVAPHGRGCVHLLQDLEAPDNPACDWVKEKMGHRPGDTRALRWRPPLASIPTVEKRGWRNESGFISRGFSV